MSTINVPLPASAEGVQLPGFRLPLEQMTILPTATESQDAMPVTGRERLKIARMATLKDKHDWQHKVFDEKSVKRWRAERLQFGRSMSAPELRRRDEPVARSDNGKGLADKGRVIELEGQLAMTCYQQRDCFVLRSSAMLDINNPTVS